MNKPTNLQLQFLDALKEVGCNDSDTLLLFQEEFPELSIKRTEEIYEYWKNLATS